MFFSTSGTNTHYQRIGQGFPLVMLHGWGCDWQVWSPVIGRLSEKFQLILPDLPAFGKSELHDAVWSSKQYAEWLDQFIKETVDQKEFFLLGHSFGGKISAIYANQKQPKHLKHLFLVDSAGIPAPLSSSKKITQTFFSTIPSFIKDSFPVGVKIKLLTKIGVSTDHLVSSSQQRKILRNTIREDIRPALSLMKVPTTIIWGEHDQETPIDNAHEFHHLISKSTLEIFSESDHFPFIQDPDRFCEIVLKLV